VPTPTTLLLLKPKPPAAAAALMGEREEKTGGRGEGMTRKSGAVLDFQTWTVSEIQWKA
jgi:hypothetical protein